MVAEEEEIDAEPLAQVEKETRPQEVLEERNQEDRYREEEQKETDGEESHQGGGGREDRGSNSTRSRKRSVSDKEEASDSQVTKKRVSYLQIFVV